MTYILIALAGVTAYLLGSIPTAVWYGQAHFGIDIREHGSGNAGATNTFRVLGKRAGTAVMLIDILKGWLATSMALILFYLEVIPQEQRITFKLIFGILALIGHILPIFAGFRGGKGVATLLGMALSGVVSFENVWPRRKNPHHFWLRAFCADCIYASKKPPQTHARQRKPHVLV